mmetsp:Transcript_19443/g.57379  ORF Transcript_19443/g.57379 Transcript_19443/m.57379 type:complete len:224 (+) Transcript_19443:1-672(+)
MLPRVVTWRCCSGPAHTAAPGTSGPAPMPPLVVTWTCCSGPAQRAAPGTSGPAPMPPMVVTLRCCSGHVRRAARGTLKSASTGHPPATLRRGRGFRRRSRQVRVEPQTRDWRSDSLCLTSAPERLPCPASRSHAAWPRPSPRGRRVGQGRRLCLSCSRQLSAAPRGGGYSSERRRGVLPPRAGEGARGGARAGALAARAAARRRGGATWPERALARAGCRDGG